MAVTRILVPQLQRTPFPPIPVLPVRVVGPTGPAGQKGVNGGSTTLFSYEAKTTVQSGNPGSQFIAWNNATQIAATKLLISHQTLSFQDIDIILSLLAAGQKLIVQDSSVSGNNQVWTITGAPTNFNVNLPTSYWEVPVSLVSSAGTGTTGFGNFSQILLAVYTIPGGVSATITTAKVTVGGNTGSMTFTNGLLTAQTPAT
jgi:hypothetical protein